MHLFEKFQIPEIEIQRFTSNFGNKILEYKDEIIEKLNSKEMEWIDIFHKQYSHIDNMNIGRWPLYVFLAGAIVCLSGSATYHLFSAHSHKVSAIMARMDYGGISFLIAGSCYPPYYYLFFCDPSNLLSKDMQLFT